MMQKLKEEIEKLVAKLPDADSFQISLADLKSGYPFNRYEYIFSKLIASGVLTYAQYHQMRDDYLTRNNYLHLYEISAPRSFGETWAQNELQTHIEKLQKPTKILDDTYDGEYDFLLDGIIKIEVKASRAVDAKSNAPLYLKALQISDNQPYVMNFQ